MKYGVRIVFVILSFVMVTSLSYGDDSVIGETVAAKFLLDYDDHYGQSYKDKKKFIFSPENYRNNATEKYSLSGKRNDGRNSVYRSEHDSLISADTDIYNIPPSLVNKVTYDFTSERSSGSSSHSFLGLPSGLSDIVMVGAAFLTNLAVHEIGHDVVAQHVGAEGNKLNFFQKQGGDFFLGMSSVEEIDNRSNLPYAMGGEFFADLTFEHALREYRKTPNTYNKSLLVVSGTDFLWYCFYAFYLSSDNPSYDPITISEETGISRDMLFSIVLAKTLLNAYRVYSGQDWAVPYFKVDRYSASLNIMIPFDIGS
jgi:hypothetical protein